MKLLELKLKNFKGIKEFDLAAQGQNMNVYGMNGAGKTTLFDAFFWGIFGKDSANQANFDIKTLDKHNNPIHGLDHEVTAKIEHNGKTIELCRIYKEKWTKKNGESEKTLTGHETSFFIDEVPKSKREYEDFIKTIADEGIFKLITNPTYFNEQLGWKERRSIMLSIAGELDENSIYAANKSLEKVREMISSKGTEDAMKLLKARRTKINDEIKQIPIRIDEISLSVEEHPELVDFEALDKEKEEIKLSISGLNKNRAATEATVIKQREDIYAAAGELQKKIAELDQISKNQDSTLNLIRSELTQLERILENEKRDITFAENTIENAIAKEGRLTEQKKNLLSQWMIEKGKTFAMSEHDTICPTCKQDLPNELRETKIQEHLAEYETRKAAKMKEIEKDAERITKEINEIQNYIKSQEQTKSTAIQEIDKLTKLLQEKKDQADKMIASMDPAAEAARMNEKTMLQTKINDLRKEAEQLSGADFIEMVHQKIRALQEREIDINRTLGMKEVYEKNKIRIQELRDQEKQLANQLLQIENEIDLVETFIKDKVNIIESRLNNMFKTVKFKLFNVQVNGGLEEIFETLIDGVPYNSANFAAKINAGLEIIKKLTEYYNVDAPIFLDHRESIVNIIEIESQIINLIVSKKDKNLRVEVA